MEIEDGEVCTFSPSQDDTLLQHEEKKQEHGAREQERKEHKHGEHEELNEQERKHGVEAGMLDIQALVHFLRQLRRNVSMFLR